MSPVLRRFCAQPTARILVQTDYRDELNPKNPPANFAVTIF